MTHNLSMSSETNREPLPIDTKVIVTGENGCMDHVGCRAEVSSGPIAGNSADGSPIDWYYVKVHSHRQGQVYAWMRRCDLETEDEYRIWMAQEEALYG